MSDSIVKVKAGASIEWHANWLQNRVAVNLDGYTILSQIRDTNGSLALSLTVEKEDQTKLKGAFSLKATANQTSAIRPGVYDCDITYTNNQNGFIEATETFLVEFVKRISRDE